jgi:predicted HicB family RNase H-like nuclease
MYFLARDRVGAKAEFESLVDQYLADCDDKGEQPGVPL